MAGPATIDAGTLNQSIRGFGASSAWASGWTAAQLDSLFSITNGIGLSMLRHRIPPNNPVDVNSGAAILQGARDRGVTQIWATCWSPPAAWKSNGSVNGPGTGNCATPPVAYLLSQYYDEYATWLADYVINMRNNNAVTLFAISPQNEPNWCPDYEASYLTGAQFQTLVRDNIGPTFAARGIGGVSIIIPEPLNTGQLTALTDPCLNDANCRRYLLAGATHLYGAGPIAYPALATNGKEYWETEMSTFEAYNATMSHALTVVGWIHNSMVTANMNAFHYWWAISNNNNEGLTSQSMGNPKRYYAFGNYSKFIRPGFRRIGATAVPQAGVSVSAYSGGSTFVIVAINGTGGAINQQFNLTGITATSFTPWITDGSRNLASQAAVAVSANSFTYSLPAQSVISFVGTGATGPTATFTASPTRTNTPIPGAFCLVDDLEDLNTTNLWGGGWGTYQGSGSAVTLSVVAGGATGSTAGAASITGTIGTNDYGGVYSNLTTSGVTNVSNYIGVVFMAKGNGGNYWFQVPNNAVTTGDHYGVTFTAPAAWTPVTLLFNNAVQRGFGAGQPFDLTQVTSLQWGGAAAGALNFQIDDVRLLGAYCPGGTPTPTRTLTRTSTPTSTSTRTNTPVPTNTSTATASRTATASSTPSLTSTPTATRTSTNTPPANTPTSTSTATRTATPSSTPTSSSTATRTATASATSSPTSSSTNTPPANTATSTPTRTATASSTNTSVPTNTPTPSSSMTPTASLTVTRTATPTSSSTNTPPANTPTSTSTATRSMTPTASLTASRTATPSSTNTLVPTSTATSTATRTATSSSTSTFSPTSTQSPTSTRTLTASPTSTATGQPTATSTSTFTRTATSSSTDTPLPTSTRTSTATATSSSTPSATSSPTSTRTATLTSTSSMSPTATLTGTATSSPSLTVSPTATDTGAPTATSTLTSTRTNTPVNTATPTSTASATSSSTASPTSTATLTVSPTSTSTGAPTATSTLTSTRTNTLVNTPTATATATFSLTATATLSPTSTASATATPSFTGTLPPTATSTLSPTPTASATRTSTATLTATLTASRTATPSSTATSTNTLVSTPTASATATRTATATATASNTPTLTASSTATASLTPTATSSMSATPTLTASLTTSPTATPSPTPLVQPGATPIVFPNPITTGTTTILPQAYTGDSDVVVCLYTSTFKLVATKRFPSVPSGQTVQVDLVDDWGQQLADGVYYVAVTTKKDRKTTTLVITR